MTNNYFKYGKMSLNILYILFYHETRGNDSRYFVERKQMYLIFNHIISCKFRRLLLVFFVPCPPLYCMSFDLQLLISSFVVSRLSDRRFHRRRYVVLVTIDIFNPIPLFLVVVKDRYFTYLVQEEFEDTKGAIRIRIEEEQTTQ